MADESKRTETVAHAESDFSHTTCATCGETVNWADRVYFMAAMCTHPDCAVGRDFELDMPTWLKKVPRH